MLEYWLWLAHQPNLNEHQKLLLLQSFQSPEAVYQAAPPEFDVFSGISAQGKLSLSDKNLALYRAALDYCHREGIHILTFQDEAYPQRLKNIYDPPLVLYYKGTFPQFDGVPVVSVVGTRKSTAYGQAAAGRIAGEICACGGMVVSGLATGIDAAAMQGALQTGTPTVGVLGTGVDVIFPRENKELFQRVETCGCILSEFLPKTPGYKWNFPKRNRLISGLSVATLVVEAPERSGALSTARQALSQNRDVFAVPGNVDLPTFAGSNRLLKEGAGSVTCGWDILSEYLPLFPDKIRRAEAPRRSGDFPAPAPVPSQRKQGKTPQIPKKDIDNPAETPYIDRKTPLPALSEEEKRIVSALGSTEKRVDDLIAETGIPSGTLLRSLTMLELKKLILRLPGNRVVRK